MLTALRLLIEAEPEERWTARSALRAAVSDHRSGAPRFAWTDAHVCPNALRAARHTADPHFDAALDADRLDDASDPAACAQGVPPTLSELVDELARPPEWVDWASIKRGQDIFVRYLPAATATLFHLSLVGGFSAERIARVVASTGYMNGSGRDVLLRIAETAAFLACVTEHGGLAAHQPGWLAALRVRLLHARVRRRLRRLGWDSASWDEPINASQMAATQLAFSLNVLSGIEMLTGCTLAEQQAEDYLHLWRYIGYLLGIPDEHNACTSMSTARAHFESHLSYLIAPGPIGCGVAHAVLALRLPSGKPARRFGQRVFVCRAFIGDELADALLLPRAFRRRDRLLGALELGILSLYTRLSALPLIGWLIFRLHQAGLRLVAKRTRHFVFPLKREPRLELMARSAQCPYFVCRG